MSENKQISAKDLCFWEKGIDNFDIAILSALNDIIEGLAILQCNNWDHIVNVTYYSSCEEIYNSNELSDIMDRFEIIRAVLFGDKIKYTKLLEVFRDNVDESDLTKKKDTNGDVGNND